MKLRRNKKGFTIVELVIVIAVIGILTAVLIPTFVSLTAKANKASDQSLVKNLNTALVAAEGDQGKKNDTMQEAVEDLEEYGYKVSQLVSKSGEDLLWDSVENRFCLEKDKPVARKDVEMWTIAQSMPTAQKYSIYAGHKWSDNAVAGLKVGFDAGYNSAIASVTYVGGDSAQEVVIRTSGDQTKVVINAAADDVKFYGFAGEIDVQAVKGESLHLFGAVNKLSLTTGHVQVENTGIIFKLEANTGSITNSGYIAEQTSGAAPTGVPVGGAYQIDSLDRLEAFRDAVNSGNNFAGKQVKLVSDITLRDGWKPIGEGTRKIAAEGLYAGMKYVGFAFAGEFDGNGKTISNLNNKGFVPTAARVAGGIYAYGLFALTTSGANIHDVKLANVDIDSTRYTGADGDSVGALIGFSAGSLTVKNVEVSGSIKAVDGVGSIIGRAYNQSEDEIINVDVEDCKSNATLSGTDVSGSTVGGIMGFVQLRKGGNQKVGCPLTVKGCEFTGTTAHAVYTANLYVQGEYVVLQDGSQAGTSM